MAVNKGIYLLSLVVGLLGVLLSVWPTQIFGSCPASVRQARSQFWSLLGMKEPHLDVFGFGSVAGQGDFEADPGTGLRLYTLEELKAHDGNDEGKPILLGMNGDVFDVTEKGRQFYGKGAGYQVFSGKDSTRALSLGSLEEDDVAKGGDVSDFTEAQRKMVADQHEFYLGKYPRVGKIKSPYYGFK